MMINSYSTIFAIGHRAAQPLLEVPCIVEEKIDGSQFSFQRIEDEVKMRSKGAEVFAGQGGMFEEASHIEADYANMVEGYIYRCEYLQKPKHNVLKYDRVPQGNLIVFDVEHSDGFAPPEEKKELAAVLKLETVPVLYQGIVTLEVLQGLLERESVLGGPKIEGVVIKPVGYSLWGVDKKVLMAKYVSEAFKETHRKEWKSDSGGNKDVIALLVASLNTEARWQKAVQHLREAEKLENSPRDIGPLMLEMKYDTLLEEKDFIAEKLLGWALPQLKQALGRGLPEWYKQKLMEEAFSNVPDLRDGSSGGDSVVDAVNEEKQDANA